MRPPKSLDVFIILYGIFGELERKLLMAKLDSKSKAMDAFVSYVDEHENLYKDRLAEAVAIPSISAELEEHGPDILRMIEWTAQHVDRLGGSYEIRTNPVGDNLPPILMAEFPVNPKAHTVCVYGHLDVQPAQQSDGWNTDPFVLTEIDGKLYGRGSTDDKGPALSWLWVIEAHQELGLPLPVNIKLLFEYVGCNFGCVLHFVL